MRNLVIQPNPAFVADSVYVLTGIDGFNLQQIRKDVSYTRMAYVA